MGVQRHECVGLALLYFTTVLLVPPKLAAAPAQEIRVIRAAEGYGHAAAPGPLLDPGTSVEIASPRAAAEVYAKVHTADSPRALTIGDHWIYDAYADVYDDYDGDGYYRFVSVGIDVDTIFNRSFVYAVLYTSPDGELFDAFYTTHDFAITGATSDDEYLVELELVSGYPPGLYDVLIELYDASTGVLMDEFGPAQSAALELLPLEDASYDVPPVIIVEGHGGGGGASPWALLGLLALLGAKRRRQRAPPA